MPWPVCYHALSFGPSGPHTKPRLVLPLPNATKSDLLLVLVTLLAAAGWVFSQEAVRLMPPLLFMCLRFLIAGGLLALAGHRQLRRMSREQLLRSLRVGLVFGLGMSCWVMGLHFGKHLGEGAFLASLAVVMVPIIARVVFGEIPPPTTWLALPVAVGGLALLSLNGGQFRPEAGQLFFLAAAMIFALYFTLNTRAANVQTVTTARGVMRREKIPALGLTAVALITVGLVTGLLSLISEPWRPTLTHLHSALLGWLLASALIATAARFFVQTYAQSLSSHSHGVVILVLEPIWVALFAALWFDESMSGTQLAGCGMIFLSLLINRWSAISKLLKRWL